MLDTRCFDCGESNSLAVNISDGDTITCTECDATFCESDLADQIAALTAIHRWLLQHPARADGTPTAGEQRAADTAPIGADPSVPY